MTDRPGAARLEQLERRVKADPTSVAFAALAEEYRRLERFTEAIDVCRKGLTRHPAYVSARVTLGRALLDAGRLDEARVELERALAVAPENLAAIRGLAEIHRAGGGRPAHEPEAPAPRSEDASAPAVQAASGGTPPQPVGRAWHGAPTQPAPPAGDPRLTALQAFLDAILAARAARDTASAWR